MISVHFTSSSIIDELRKRHPPGATLSTYLRYEGRFIAITMSILFSNTGDPIGSSETVTEQLAVPPRCSGPYEGTHATSVPTSLPAKVISSPFVITPCPPKPAQLIFYVFPIII